MKIDSTWTLFLDRDGVINKRIIDGYVTKLEEFEFLPGVVEALKVLKELFATIVVVSNQQGIGKGLMTTNQVDAIHDHLIKVVKEEGGRIDKIYYCASLKSDGSFYRKPKPGMAMKARKEFPNIRFKKSIMVGDSISDMVFGKNLKMKTVFISDDIVKIQNHPQLIDFAFRDLISFSKFITLSPSHHRTISPF